jgi:hypothetical protein
MLAFARVVMLVVLAAFAAATVANAASSARMDAGMALRPNGGTLEHCPDCAAGDMCCCGDVCLHPQLALAPPAAIAASERGALLSPELAPVPAGRTEPPELHPPRRA